MLADPNSNANLLGRARNNHLSMLTSYLYALSNGPNADFERYAAALLAERKQSFKEGGCA